MTLSNRIYGKIIPFGKKSRVNRWISYFITGWLSVVWLKPAALEPQQPPLKFHHLLLGAVFSILLLMLAGQGVSVLQPVLSSIGPLTLERAIVITVILLNLWRWVVGRNLINSHLTHDYCT